MDPASAVIAWPSETRRRRRPVRRGPRAARGVGSLACARPLSGGERALAVSPGPVLVPRAPGSTGTPYPFRLAAGDGRRQDTFHRPQSPRSSPGRRIDGRRPRPRASAHGRWRSSARRSRRRTSSRENPRARARRMNVGLLLRQNRAWLARRTGALSLTGPTQREIGRRDDRGRPVAGRTVFWMEDRGQGKGSTGW